MEKLDKKQCDFSGWATRFDIKCADDRTILRHAFEDQDGQIVPLVWGHDHDTNDAVLGKGLLENRREGVYMYGFLNKTDRAQKAKEQIAHGDITALSIYANRLTEDSRRNVSHGIIREVSLVLAGANPGAYIDYSLAHGLEDADDVAAIIYNPIEDLVITDEEPVGDDENYANEDPQNENEEDIELYNDDELEHGCCGKEKKELCHEGETLDVAAKRVIDKLSEEDQEVIYALIGAIAPEDEENNNEEGNPDMKHDIFSNEMNDENVISHDLETAIMADAQRFGTLKAALNAYEEELDGKTLSHSITSIGYIYPEYKNALPGQPQFMARRQDWVAKVMQYHTTPFQRVKSIFADLTADEARANGYVKGDQKAEEVISLLKRTTDPQTIYKLQKVDRDDVIDIEDFDVVNMLRDEMKLMLDEEIARAILIGDGRTSLSTYKIKEDHVRPIWTDSNVFTVNTSFTLTTSEAAEEDNKTKVKKFMRACVKARKDYRGTGTPMLFTTEDMLSDMLLLEDTLGHVIYDSVQKLCNYLRVSDIQTVPVMENATRVSGAYTYAPLGIIVNMDDYNVGKNSKGGTKLFDDFDIDYNKYTYLIETRFSGALIRWHSAIAVEYKYDTPAEG